MSCFQSFSCVLIIALSGCSTPLAYDSGTPSEDGISNPTESESDEETQASDDSDSPDGGVDSDASDEDDTPPTEPPDEEVSDEDESDEEVSAETEDEGFESVSTDSLPTALPPGGTEGELLVETAVAATGVIADLNVTISLTHTCTKDLSATLVSPEGTIVELFDLTVRPVCSSDLSNTVLDDDATALLASGSSPFVGPHRPSGNLADFNGEVADGTWILSIVDDTIGDRGSLTKWTLDFVFEG